MGAAIEFSRILRVEPWPKDGLGFDVEAKSAERARIAERLGLITLERLHGKGRIARVPTGKLLRLDGRLDAVGEQRCVVTLDPLPVHVDIAIERLFGDVPPVAPGTEVEVDAFALEIDPIEDGRIDVGEVLVEELALALDPYPRLGRASGDALDLPPTVERHVSIDLAEPEPSGRDRRHGPR